MAVVTALEDAADPRLRDYVALTDVELRRRLEPAEGLFVAEGAKVIERALAAGYPMRSMLLSTRWVETMAAHIEAARCPVYVGSPQLLEAITGYHVHRGALAAMGRKPPTDPAALLASAKRVVVMEKVNDHTNIGAVFRGVAGLGFDAVLLSPDCADPLYRRSVKVSMGAVFAVPYARLAPWPRALEQLAEHGFRRLALTPDPEAVALPELKLGPGDRVALVMGSEGDGLSRRAFAACDVKVRIPMSAGVDSLNVAAATAVAGYAVTYGTGSGA